MTEKKLLLSIIKSMSIIVGNNFYDKLEPKDKLIFNLANKVHDAMTET